MTYGSVCSGIEAATVAWEPLGWRAAWFAEIDAFPSAVLATRHPSVPNLGDMTRLHEHEDFRRSAIDLLVGGTPCQSFSVAGLRNGLADPRGNLALVFLALADRARPRWLVWENVPGVLSSNGGRDFGAFLGGLADLGYGFAYRVLDAQYFGLAQRRKRVFVVGYLGDWRRAAAVRFERASLSGNPAPRREARKGAAGASAIGARSSERDGELIGRGVPAVANPLTARMHKGVNTTMDEGQTMIPVVAFDARQSDVITYGDKAGPLDTDGHSQAIASRSVRRLTPRECERLQGFPDDYTLISYRGKPAADGPRYKAIGNSMAVNVMRWIGGRIQLVEIPA